MHILSSKDSNNFPGATPKKVVLTPVTTQNPSNHSSGRWSESPKRSTSAERGLFVLRSHSITVILIRPREFQMERPFFARRSNSGTRNPFLPSDGSGHCPLVAGSDGQNDNFITALSGVKGFRLNDVMSLPKIWTAAVDEKKALNCGFLPHRIGSDLTNTHRNTSPGSRITPRWSPQSLTNVCPFITDSIDLNICQLPNEGRKRERTSYTLRFRAKYLHYPGRSVVDCNDSVH